MGYLQITTVRRNARTEGIQILSGRESLARHLTLTQAQAIEEHAPFELSDSSHPALQPE